MEETRLPAHLHGHQRPLSDDDSDPAAAVPALEDDNNPRRRQEEDRILSLFSLLSLYVCIDGIPSIDFGSEVKSSAAEAALGF